jgi:hypothetical protein
MEGMMDRDDRIRQAFTEGGDEPAIDRDRGWTRVLRARMIALRRRALARTSVLTIAAAALIAVAVTSDGSLWHGIASRLGAGGVVLDSLQDTEISMTAQAQTSSETSGELIMLLNHRRGLRDQALDAQESRMRIQSTLERLPDHENAPLWRREVTLLEERLADLRLELGLVDRELAQHAGAADLPASEAVALVPNAPLVAPDAVQTERLMILYGSGAVLLLLMVLVMQYVRRTANATVRTLSAIQAQATSQHETLTAGIEAIALEVERLGEGQRYMSKLVGGGGEAHAVVRSQLEDVERKT